MTEPTVLISRDGGAGHIVLNRPKAINALTHEMVTLIQSALDSWADDPSVQTVVLTGSGERGLCAGGDIVSIYQDGLAHGTASAEFWAAEYRLDATIADYPKPFVAIMDGIVLGGGIGLSAHASVRVVTERSKIGMPETGIGFFPDVGGTYLLSRAPGELGTHLALTAGSVRAGDAIAVGLADWYVTSDQLPALIASLASVASSEAIAAVASAAPSSALLADREWIDAAYEGDDLVKILARLADSEIEAARETAVVLASKSPTSVKVTLRALRSAADLATLREALDQEYRLSVRFHGAHDFIEGVRAQVIDKDRNPQWVPSTIDEVAEETVAAYFAPLGADELGLTKESAV
ncbi:enoyl-CoA hydratase/isomerase family protein [Streptomyces sp. SID13031]|uniref:enoyl-CoA hydratase/isomerase family protein n=1 Tax=Streptomyces sp. SID13031 TaxID=2706046 RepID=UPI0013CBD9EE|nr:enoyl-CoA hydratase/isomerase family protein [Streptomyces sp. SID13031]NEA30219.1 enoyl-CoA hydratase/isomerase family protein [Streptomyces sp. SID13031]